MCKNHSFNSFDDIAVIDNEIKYVKDLKDFEYCEDCKQHVKKDNVINVDNEKNICFNCLEHKHNMKFYHCKHCGKLSFEIIGPSFLHRLNYIYFSTKFGFPGNNGFCADCKPQFKCKEHYCSKEKLEGHDYCEDHVGYEKLKEYSYKPSPIFHGDLKNKKDFHIGVELEINFKNEEDKLDFLNNWNNDFFYFKKDGSLSSYGLEVVSHPATLAYHIKSKYWNQLFESLSKYKLDTNKCGLHFHISRKNLTDDAIYNIDYLVSNYDNIINEIGSRGYCRFAQKTKGKFGVNRFSCHYDACNLSNSNTVELRFCKSTTNFKAFINKIKKIASLVCFCEIIEKEVISNKHYVNKSFDYFKKELLSRI